MSRDVYRDLQFYKRIDMAIKCGVLFFGLSGLLAWFKFFVTGQF